MTNISKKSRISIEKEKDLRKLLPIERRFSMLCKEAIVGPLVNVLPKTDACDLINVLFFHNVLDDERQGFEHQLKYLRGHGDFISMDDAISVFEERKGIRGRYFCVTFDDGFKSCVKNALPILAENNCPAAFFIPTDYIDSDLYQDEEILDRFFLWTQYPKQVGFEFMDWADCRKLVEAGMTVGSHTCSHARLSDLSISEVKIEMSRSKRRIEDILGTMCLHFSAPFGRQGVDLSLDVHPMLAKEVGFKSFLTVSQGPNTYMTDPFKVKRNFLAARWKTAWLDYYFFCKINCKISYL